MRLFLLALLLAFATDAFAQHNAKYRPKNDATVTAVSGSEAFGPFSSNSIATLDDFGADFLHAITLWDGPGGPCSVTATGWKARNGFPSGIDTSWIREQRFETKVTSTLGVRQTTIECPDGRDGLTVEAAFPTPPPSSPTRPGSFPAVTFRGHYGAAGISGLRVCTDGTSRGRVRGLSIFTSTVNAGGNDRVERSGTETTEFDGCAEWGRAVHCPKGQLATGIELHYGSSRDGGDFLRGAALHCTQVRIRPLD